MLISGTLQAFLIEIDRNTRCDLAETGTEHVDDEIGAYDVRVPRECKKVGRSWSSVFKPPRHLSGTYLLQYLHQPLRGLNRTRIVFKSVMAKTRTTGRIIDINLTRRYEYKRIGRSPLETASLTQRRYSFRGVIHHGAILEGAD